ncbi:MAG: hypothetical protein KC708_16820 [Anaerolineae bacterium]|nr:hypothetical protein [Anaerolineae bacterium]
MTDPNPTELRTQRRRSGADLHRKETRRHIWLPFLLVCLFLLFLILLVALPTDPSWRTRASFIADFMSSILIFCPAIICSFVFYMLIALGIYGMNRLHSGARSPLEKVENMTAKIATRVDETTEKINEKVVDANSRIASLTHFMSVFDQPENDDDPTGDKKEK